MDWLINLGYWGLFIGSFLAGTVFPLNSDILMIGILNLGGNPWICLAAATSGNWLGSMLSYGIGWLGKWEWLSKWFKIEKSKLDKQKKVIDKYGVFIALFSWFPIVGTLSVITLGFYKVKPKTTALFILIGCFIRFLLWTLLYLHFI